jgi:ankyrin repeat protein
MRTMRFGRVWLVLVSLVTLGATDADVRLIDAVKSGDAAAVSRLLQQGVDINTRQGDGATALHWAAYRNNLDAADVLIRAGAAVDATNDLGVTPLWVAATLDNTAMIARLLQARGNPNLAPPTGGNPLMIASRNNNIAAVKLLLAHGANANAKEDAQGQTALMWATAQQHPGVVQVLLEAGADVHARTASSRRRVLLCCQSYIGDPEGAAWVEQGGFTPLMFAARHGDVGSARLLLDAGARIDDTAAVGTTALVVAAQYGHRAVAALLLDKGADPNAARAGHAALHWATLRSDTELVRALLSHGANPNVRLSTGTPLKRSGGEYAFDKFLIGATPFLLAARKADVDVMRVLVAGGANPTLSLNDGRTPVMAAAEANNKGLLRARPVEGRILEAVKVALDLGVDVNAANQTGNTALHMAVANKFETVVRLLAERGARLDARNQKGQTPLAVALAPPQLPQGTVANTDLTRYRAEYAKWEASKGRMPTAELLRSLGAKEE